METALATTDQRSPRRGPKDGLTNATRVMTEEQIRPRHRLMVDYMVSGLAHASLLERLPERLIPNGLDEETGARLFKMGRPDLHEALSLEDAATACNIRPRVARSLSRQRVFQRLLAEETEAFRNGAKARAVRRIDTLVHDPGAGKAADRKVQLSAAQALIGEGDGNRSGATVNVYNGGQHFNAGIVIMRRGRDGQPVTIPNEAA